MMTGRRKIASSSLLFLLTELSWTSGDRTCSQTRPSKIPANSTLFSDEYWEDENRAEMRYICDFVTGASGQQGSDFVINKCSKGVWDYTNGIMPDCKDTKSWCFNEYSFGYGNNCYRWIPTVTWELSEYLCSKYSGSRPAVIDDKAELRAIEKFLKENPLGFTKHQPRFQTCFFWLGLHRIEGGMEWTTKARTNDWRSWWKEGHPRGDATRGGLLFPDMKLFTPSNEDMESFIGSLRMFALCKIEANKAIYPTYTITKRLHVVKEDKSFRFEIPGASLHPIYSLIYDLLPISMKELLQSNSKFYNQEDLVMTARIILEGQMYKTAFKEWKSSLIAAPLKDVKPDRTVIGIQCGRKITLQPVHKCLVHLDQHNYVDEDLPPIYPQELCQLTETNAIILPITNDASIDITGTWLLSDWTTGMEQHMYVYVIDSDGWSAWTTWSSCSDDTVISHVNSTKELSFRTRVCGAAFDRYASMNVQACEGRRSDIHRKPCGQSDPSPYQQPKHGIQPDQEESVVGTVAGSVSRGRKFSSNAANLLLNNSDKDEKDNRALINVYSKHAEEKDIGEDDDDNDEDDEDEPPQDDEDPGDPDLESTGLVCYNDNTVLSIMLLLSFTSPSWI